VRSTRADENLFLVEKQSYSGHHRKGPILTHKRHAADLRTM
jgi:hypothetical protein